MFSFAGISLSAASPEIALWIERHVEAHRLYEFPETTWPGPGRQVWPWQFFPLPPVKLNTLRWPVGASRWAVGHFLVSEAQLNLLRPQTGLDGTTYRTANLVFSDGAQSITTPLYLLPAVPLATPAPGAGMWLITLVDERWFWWQKAAAITVAEGQTRWTDLYTAIGNALNLPINADPIISYYLKPPASLTSLYQPLPLLLDAVARCVGQRIVRSLSGVVYAQNATTAKASVSAQLAMGYPKYSGGQFALTPG